MHTFINRQQLNGAGIVMNSAIINARRTAKTEMKDYIRIYQRAFLNPTFGLSSISDTS